MMNIYVRKLIAQKSFSGTVKFDYAAPGNLIDIPFVKFSAPVKVEAEYVIFEDDSVEVKGKVVYDLAGQCSRCLQETSQHREGEIDAYFQPFVGGEDYSYFGGVIDLTDAVNDAIMASLPYALSCGKDCPGIRY